MTTEITFKQLADTLIAITNDTAQGFNPVVGFRTNKCVSYAVGVRHGEAPRCIISEAYHRMGMPLDVEPDTIYNSLPIADLVDKGLATPMTGMALDLATLVQAQADQMCEIQNRPIAWETLRPTVQKEQQKFLDATTGAE